MGIKLPFMTVSISYFAHKKWDKIYHNCVNRSAVCSNSSFNFAWTFSCTAQFDDSSVGEEICHLRRVRKHRCCFPLLLLLLTVLPWPSPLHSARVISSQSACQYKHMLHKLISLLLREHSHGFTVPSSFLTWPTLWGKKNRNTSHVCCKIHKIKNKKQTNYLRVYPYNLKTICIFICTNYLRVYL